MKLNSRETHARSYSSQSMPIICSFPKCLRLQSLLALRSRVPFVGCKSDGQAGLLKPPTDKSKDVSIVPEVARQLAYYKAEQGFGVLAPRGWNCFGTYGSGGSNLYITPQPINPALLLSDKWTGFTGPAIQLSGEDGGTSGRFGVRQANRASLSRLQFFFDPSD